MFTLISGPWAFMFVSIAIVEGVPSAVDWATWLWPYSLFSLVTLVAFIAYVVWQVY